MKFLPVALLLFAQLACAEKIEHEGATYWIYRLDPATARLDLFLSEKEGTPNTFPGLEERLNQRGLQMMFAVNAGIFEPNFRSSGLHIADGKTLVPLNLKDFKKTSESRFTPNFYLKPNGVFYLLQNGTAGIVESTRFPKLNLPAKIRLANQSGPLLVDHGKIHPISTRNSESKRHRNGVGVTDDGKIVFACTVQSARDGLSNLYHFASLFPEKLNCQNALYLDGDISYIFIRGLTPPLRKTNWFGGIFAVTGKRGNSN